MFFVHTKIYLSGEIVHRKLGFSQRLLKTEEFENGAFHFSVDRERFENGALRFTLDRKHFEKTPLLGNDDVTIIT